mmetsp:Transcript_14373/g.21838  ORF Transcript_14373/g.21838 Transcript_14373/m.21838 type:complete len:210 (-) Transcript_14373:205-834(-)
MAPNIDCGRQLRVRVVERQKKNLKRVTFGATTTRSFNSSSIIQVPKSSQSKTALIHLDSTCNNMIKNTHTLLVEMQQLGKLFHSITLDKWMKPWGYLFKGEVMEFGGEENVKRWVFTWSFMTQLINGHIPKKDTVIIKKRGFTVAEILRRSCRNLDHSEYTNSLVQEIYKRLSPRLKKRTDLEWLKRRMKNRECTLRTETTAERRKTFG